MTTPIRLAAAMVIFIVGGLVVAAQDTQIRNFRPVTDETLRNPSPDAGSTGAARSTAGDTAL